LLPLSVLTLLSVDSDASTIFGSGLVGALSATIAPFKAGSLSCAARLNDIAPPVRTNGLVIRGERRGECCTASCQAREGDVSSATADGSSPLDVSVERTPAVPPSLEGTCLPV
jgi:hypothetical protein